MPVVQFIHTYIYGTVLHIIIILKTFYLISFYVSYHFVLQFTWFLNFIPFFFFVLSRITSNNKIFLIASERTYVRDNKYNFYFPQTISFFLILPVVFIYLVNWLLGFFPIKLYQQQQSKNRSKNSMESIKILRKTFRVS